MSDFTTLGVVGAGPMGAGIAQIGLTAGLTVTLFDVSAEALPPGSLVDVMPQHLHRVEAVSDILMFEVSTPYLDDVIRVRDDSNRANGRITSEHK